MDLRQPQKKRTKRKSILARSFFVIVGALILTTLAVDATDNINSFSRSIIGSVIVGVSGGSESGSVCPSGMTFVSSPGGGFCIDVYEVSADSDCPHEHPRNVSETQENLNASGCVPVSEEGRIPWTNVSQTQAIEACARAGKHLPSNEEWYLGSLGIPDKSRGWTQNDCNVAGNWQTGSVGQTGSGVLCRSSAGTFDMIGNVWEWTFETVRNGMYEGSELPDSGFVDAVSKDGIPTKTTSSSSELFYHDRFWLDKENITGIFRGGFWGNESEAGRYAVHSEIPPSFSGGAVGFRCAH